MRYLLVALLLISVSGYSMNKETCDPPKCPSPFMLDKIAGLDISGYRTWPWLTGFELSELHWNSFISIFIYKGGTAYRNNYLNYVLEFYDDEQPAFVQYPTGTIVVKENYSSHDGLPDQPTSLTIMVKHQPGYDSNNGDWEYIKLLTNGEVSVRGKGQDPMVKKMCTNCHANVYARDFVFSTVMSSISD